MLRKAPPTLMYLHSTDRKHRTEPPTD